MNAKLFLNKIIQYPRSVLYGTLLGIIAFVSALPMFASGMYDAALVDLAIASILTFLMLKKIFSISANTSSLPEKCAAWIILIIADILALLPVNNFAGGICTTFAFSLLVCALILYFSGTEMTIICIAPTLWCCVFMPYHEEIMLLLSFPLRLSATMLSGAALNLSGISIVYSGTSLSLPGVSIAITDACSGIKQLDAFILIAFIAVLMLHKKTIWKFLHFAFIVPSIIIGNSMRIILTVILFRMMGETVLDNSWHTALGYTQILFTLLIFIAVGKVFCMADKKTVEEK